MKILLIEPPGFQKGVLNVGIAYIAGAVNEQSIAKAEALDINHMERPLSSGEIVEYVKAGGYSVVGFSAKTANVGAVKNIAMALHKELPDLKLVAGGAHITLFAKKFLESEPYFHACVQGDGEEPFNNILKSLKEGIELTELPGLLFRRSGKLYDGGIYYTADLDSLPHPDFTVFSKEAFAGGMEHYPLVTSRGCPYKCSYCSVGIVSGKKFRRRSLESLYLELKDAKERFGLKSFNIIDDNFTLDIERAKKFCRRLIEMGKPYSWYCGNGVRCDKMDDELVALMKEAGCHTIMLGVETGNPEAFNKINKGEELEDVEKAIAMVRRHGIRVGGFFIIGLPFDNRQSLKITLDFIHRTGLDWAHFGMLVPYPGTPVYDWIRSNGAILKEAEHVQHFGHDVNPTYDIPSYSANDMYHSFYEVNTKLGTFEFITNPTWPEWKKKLIKLYFILRYDVWNLKKHLKSLRK